MKKNNYFGKNLRRLRLERGLSQEKLANMIGRGRVSITEWELGTKYPQVNWLYEIAEKLGVEPSELINVENSDI